MSNRLKEQAARAVNAQILAPRHTLVIVFASVHGHAQAAVVIDGPTTSQSAPPVANQAIVLH